MKQQPISNGENVHPLAFPHFERLKLLFESEPAYQLVGIKLTSLAQGSCITTTPVKQELLHHRGAVQGGIIATIADATAGHAALAALPQEAVPDDIATIEFKTSYFRPALAEELVCTSNVTFTGGRVVFCNAQIYLNEPLPENLCAESTLTFTRIRTHRRT